MHVPLDRVYSEAINKLNPHKTTRLGFSLCNIIVRGGGGVAQIKSF